MLKINFAILAIFLFNTILSFGTTGKKHYPFKALDHMAALNFMRSKLKTDFCNFYYEFAYGRGDIHDHHAEPGAVTEGYRVCKLPNNPYNYKAFSAKNLPKLKFSVPAYLAAVTHAKHMDDYNYFNHRGLDGSTPKTRVQRWGNLKDMDALENIAYSFIPKPPLGFVLQYYIDGGVRTRGHRRHQLSTYITHEGVGAYLGRKHYCVMIGVKNLSKNSRVTNSLLKRYPTSLSDEGKNGDGLLGDIDPNIKKNGDLIIPSSTNHDYTVRSHISNWSDVYKDAPGTIKCPKTWFQVGSHQFKNRKAKRTLKTCKGWHHCKMYGYRRLPNVCSYDVLCCMHGTVQRAGNDVKPLN